MAVELALVDRAVDPHDGRDGRVVHEGIESADPACEIADQVDGRVRVGLIGPGRIRDAAGGRIASTTSRA